MLVLSADSVYELLMRGPCADSVSAQILTARGNVWAPPHMPTEVFTRLCANQHQKIMASGDLVARVNALERLPCAIVRGSTLLEEIGNLNGANLSLSEAMYIATSRSTLAPILTTQPLLATRVRGFARTILIS